MLTLAELVCRARAFVGDGFADFGLTSAAGAAEFFRGVDFAALGLTLGVVGVLPGTGFNLRLFTFWGPLLSLPPVF